MTKQLLSDDKTLCDNKPSYYITMIKKIHV